MKFSKTVKVLLWVAVIQSTLMAVVHFLIPNIFPWEQHVGTLYPAIRWALFAINFAYSSLLLWGSLLTLILLFRQSSDRFLAVCVLGGIGLCWLAGAVYEFVLPFPVEVVRWVLPGFAAVTAMLYLIPAVNIAHHTPQSMGRQS